MEIVKHFVIAMLFGIYIAINITIIYVVRLNVSKVETHFNNLPHVDDELYHFYTDDPKFPVQKGDSTIYINWSSILYSKIALKENQNNIEIFGFKRPSVKKENAIFLVFPSFFIIKSDPIFKIKSE